MKSIKQQYIDLQEGNMSQANFMRNLRMTLPQYVTNVTSFNDSVRILKNKGILTENYTPKELAIGVEVELEHTKDTETAAKIAMDHLRENPKYYSELAASGIEKPSTMQKIKNKLKSFTDPGKDPFGVGYDTMAGVFEGEEKNSAAEELAIQMGDYDSAVVALQDEMGLSPREADAIASRIYSEDYDPGPGEDENFEREDDKYGYLDYLDAMGLRENQETYEFGGGKYRKTYVPTGKFKEFNTRDIEGGYHSADSDRVIKVGYVFGEYGSLGMSMTSRSDEMGMTGVYVVDKKLDDNTWSCEKLKPVDQEPLNESQNNEGKWKTVNGKDLYAQFKEIDNLNGQEVLIGIDCEMEKNHELTKLAAAKIVLKNLKKNPIYYTASALAGKEGYEPEYLGGKSAQPEARQMQPLEKNMGNVVDKKMGMQPVKDVEKVKASANKAKKETVKVEKGISLMSLIAKTVRGVQKMDATGEKMKKISTK